METELPVSFEESLAMEGETWHVVSAAVQGTSHQRQGLPCQDKLAYRALPGGRLAIALADGAGTADQAETGAQRAVEAALDALESGEVDEADDEEAGWVERVWGAFDHARQAMEALAEEQGEPLRAYAATLTCLLLGQDRLVIGQIGDGAVVVKGEDGELFTATHAQRGEYANETCFLTQEDALEQVEIQVIESPVQALAVMSDGLTRLALKMPSYEPHAPFFQPLFDFLDSSNGDGAAAEKQLADFLASERVCARTDDDKALGLVKRTADGRPPASADESQEG